MGHMTKEIEFDGSTVPKPGDNHKPHVRSNQAEFQEMFGDFKAKHVKGFWIGPAPKGEWVGICFSLEDGSTVKASIPYTLWQTFGNEFVLAMMSASEICEAAYSPAKGNA
jgi:hypothetical protein